MDFPAPISQILIKTIFLSYIDFGLDGISCKKGRNHVYRLKSWAEMDVRRTLKAHFGHLDWAEVGNSLIGMSEIYIFHSNPHI